jgi:hypothetical protein
MANISLTLYTDGFFGSVLKSPSQMGSLSIHNSVTNISPLGTFSPDFHLSYWSAAFGRFLQVSALASHLLADCANFTPTPGDNNK